ncbi:hypothetical protein [Mameliella sp.]|uniref:hypothetical protein n=2 Tax=Mameliella sp. TaxID=1924940 RepID=UPI003BAC3C49
MIPHTFFPMQDMDMAVESTGFVPSRSAIDGGCHYRSSPQGEILQSVGDPVAKPAGVPFGGHGFDIRFVTSLQQTAGRVDLQPETGRLIAFGGLGAEGRAQMRFRE